MSANRTMSVTLPTGQVLAVTTPSGSVAELSTQPQVWTLDGVPITRVYAQSLIDLYREVMPA